MLLPFPANGELRNTEFRSQEPVGYRATMRMAEEGLFSQKDRKDHEDNLFDLKERTTSRVAGRKNGKHSLF